MWIFRDGKFVAAQENQKEGLREKLIAKRAHNTALRKNLNKYLLFWLSKNLGLFWTEKN